MTNEFKIWDLAGTNPYVKSIDLPTYESNFVAAGKIYADIFNGILKDVSMVTVSILEALAATTIADTSSMTFNNEQSDTTVKNNIAAMLGNIKSPALKNQINVTIKNNSATTLATTQTDGSADIILTLPSAVDINISGKAATSGLADEAKKFDHLQLVKIKNSKFASYTTNVDISNAALELNVPETSTEALKLVDNNRQALNIGGNKSAVIIESGIPTDHTSWNASLFDNIMNAFNFDNYDIKSDGRVYINFTRDSSKNYLFIVTINYNGERVTAPFFLKAGTANNSSVYRCFDRNYRLNYNASRLELQHNISGSSWLPEETMDTVFILTFSKVTPYTSS